MEESKSHRIKVVKKGKSLLSDPILNKGSSFTKEERGLFDLEGLLPPGISTMKQQLERSLLNFQSLTDDLSKYNFLTGLQNRNETLFFRFCSEHVSQTLPYIYTPVVGDAALNFNVLYHTSRGLYISYENKDQIETILKNFKETDIEVIVATDGGRILGLGDVGVGGMTIPIGKTSLYTLFGGVDPKKVLPIFLDVGTDNETLLKDPLYLGRRENRVLESEYFEFMDAFVNAVKKVFPKAMLQWEDLLGIYAQKVLDRYKDLTLSFNDDIQGTAAVVLAGLLTALQMKESELKNEKIAIFGGGAAGLGIAHMMYRYLIHNKVSEKTARNMIHIIDKNGLTYKNQEGLRDEHKFFAKEKPSGFENIIQLDDVIKFYKITILIGASAKANAFSEISMKLMVENTNTPIVFPLSNPHTKAEATPEMIINATKGAAIVATGTAFKDVNYRGKTYHIGQCNNVYIFPGVGLFTTAFEVKSILEEFFYVAGETLSKISPPLLFPKLEDLRQASKSIALEIAKYAVIKKIIPQMSEEDLLKKIEGVMWNPEYKEYYN